MSVAATIKLQITSVETLGDTPSAAATKKVVTHDEYNDTHALSAATTPPVTKCAHFLQALTDAAATVDLTAMVGTNGAPTDGSGLKVQALKIKNLGANTLTITPGAANGYDFMAAGVIVLAQNQEFAFYGNDATPDIAAGDKEIDLAGTGVQTSEWTVVVG